MSEERIIFWIDNNRRFLAISVISILIGAATFMIWRDFQTKNIKEISSEFYFVKKDLEEEIEKINPKDKKNKKNNRIANLLLSAAGKIQKIYSPSMDQKAKKYTQIIEKYSKIDLAAFHALYLADFYDEYGKKEKGRALLESLAAERKSATKVNQWLFFRLSSYYMDQKDCNKALPLLTKILKKKKGSYLHNEAHTQIGICHEHMGNIEKAKESYKKALQEQGQALSAKKYLRDLELKQKIKNQ